VAHRTKKDIIVCILQSLNKQPTFRTHVMHQAMLSHAQLKQFQEFLMAKGLIIDADGKLDITEKGREYLRAYLDAEAILQS
jgi:predicted transcriptional regulator